MMTHYNIPTIQRVLFAIICLPVVYWIAGKFALYVATIAERRNPRP